MKGWALKASALSAVLIAGFLFFSVRNHPYPGALLSREWNGGFWSSLEKGREGLPDREGRAIRYARSMTGTLYDPLMGRCGDFFGKRGLVVCIDVPVRAYLDAGISFPALLRESAEKHPGWFKIKRENSPRDPFFYRRVRNYYDLFRHHPFLEADRVPRPGDWAFYGRFHIAMVISAGPGGYEVIEANPHRGRVAANNGGNMERTWGAPDFFGRIRPASPGNVRMGDAAKKD